MTESVILYPAYTWTCDECGHELFGRGVVPDVPPEDIKVMQSDCCVLPWEKGCLTMIPDIVCCPYCDAEYTTKSSGNA